jgi:hypothetical protein
MRPAIKAGLTGSTEAAKVSMRQLPSTGHPFSFPLTSAIDRGVRPTYGSREAENQARSLLNNAPKQRARRKILWSLPWGCARGVYADCAVNQFFNKL